MTISGIKRTADYQDADYAKVYLDRLEAVKECDSVFGDGTYRTLNEVARYTALWMTYEDTIRVADLKLVALDLIELTTKRGLAIIKLCKSVNSYIQWLKRSLILCQLFGWLDN